jgi:hypothetical protein
MDYERCQDWQADMDEFRRGVCRWCKQDIADCGLDSPLGVRCEYQDIIVPVLFLLFKLGWLREWISRQGYTVGFGEVQLQRWLNELSDLGGVNRTRAIEAFEEYALEFVRHIE